MRRFKKPSGTELLKIKIGNGLQKIIIMIKINAWKKKNLT